MDQDGKHQEIVKARELIEHLRDENLEWCQQENSQDSLGFIRDDIFDEKTHFILELVQNADDCSSDEVIFNLFDDRLIVKNTGIPFGEKNVEALSHIGRSTKEEEHIGFFGIGFKSVFQVSDAPEIHSGPYHFRYDDQNLIVPEWIERPESKPPTGAVFILPFKYREEIYKEIEKQIRKFDGSVLLFLKHLKKIRVNKDTYEIKPVGDSENEFNLFKNGGKTSQWKKYCAVLPIPKNKQKTLQIDRGRKWSKKKLEEIAISFRVDKKGYPLLSTKGCLYAFFPTEIITGLSFNLQADFFVPVTRKTLKEPSGDWNRWIFDNTYRPVAKLINDFKSTPGLKTAFYRLLPKNGELNHDYLGPAKKGIDSYVLKNRTVYTTSGKWVRPSQALIPENGIASLIDSRHLKKIFNREKHYVSEDIDEEGLNYLKDIGVEQFTCEDLFEKVFPNTEWLKKRPQRWFIELYGLLWDWIQSQGYHGSWERTRAINRIREARIFLSESKRPMAVEGKRRRLYRLEQQQATFASLFKTEYELFNQKLYGRIFSDKTKNPQEKEAREKARYLIGELVPTLSEEEILNDIIKPAFRDWENQTDAKLLRYTDFVRRFVEEIDNDMILLRREGKERSYLRPQHMYMIPEYGADAAMRKLFKEDDVPFVSKHYIQKLLERTSERSKEQIASWKKLFQRLGVNERPTVVKTDKTSDHTSIEQELVKHNPKNSVESSNWGYQKRDYNFIPALVEIMDSLPHKETPDRIEKAKLIVKIINDNWDYYRKFLKSYYLFHVERASVWSKSELGPSSLALAIKEKPWVPTLKGEIAEPSHVFLNLQTIEESMGGQVEYVDGDISNRSLINFAGFNDKPSVKAALNHLRGLTERKVDDYDAFRRSYIFFRNFLGDQKSLAKERDAVIRAFKSEPLIFIPGHKTKPYRKHTEVVWVGPSFLSEFKPNLERYFDLESFFLDKLGVVPGPMINDYVDFLIYLSKKDRLPSSEEDAMIGARGKLDDALADEAKEMSGGKQRTEKQEKMLRELRKKGKVWCDDKTWASFADDLYYNDSPHIYSIFKDVLKVIYLDPRKGSKLPIHFLREFQIKGLKESVREVAPDIEEEVVREASEEETEKIRSLVPYLCGFIKKNDSEVFEDLRQKNIFSQLAFMSIRMVGELRTHYHINGIKRPNPDKKSAFYDEASNTLYLAGGLHYCVDDIGMTLSEALGDVPGLVDFIPRLVNLEEVERQNVIQRRRMDWIDLDDDIAAEEPDREDEKQEYDDEDEPVKPKERSKKRPVAKPKKKAFDAEAYLDKIDSLLASVPVTHIAEEDFQEIIGAGRQGESDGGGGSWYGMTDEQGKQIGNAAEKVVYRKEKERLKKLFENGVIPQDLSEKVDHIAERDDSAGYDIQSWNEKRKKIYIEVKGTSDAFSMEFPISREEFKKAEEKGDSYLIYRVLNVGDGKKPTISVIKNPFRLWRKNKLRLISKKLLMGVELK